MVVPCCNFSISGIEHSLDTVAPKTVHDREKVSGLGDIPNTFCQIINKPNNVIAFQNGEAKIVTNSIIFRTAVIKWAH